MTRRRTALLLLIAVLAVLNVAVYYALQEARLTQMLRVTFLDVGQGDSILIQSPTGADVLIDGGPDRSVLRELPKVLGPLDRSLDLVVATHPDRDHIGGLRDVFKRYDVKAYMEPGVVRDTSDTEALLAGVAAEDGVEAVVARRGMRLHLGRGAYADVLYPDRSVSGVETNTGSIVLRLVYGESEFFLSGDAPVSIEDWVVVLDDVEGDVLKAGHHGSRTSTGQRLVEEMSPQFVVVSAGRGNSYGHPHEEVVARIRESGATVLSTMEGAVTLYSDGRNVWVK